MVGDTTLAEITPLLEANFGNWTPPAMAKGAKTFDEAIPPPQPRIVLVDRPQSPQSLILRSEEHTSELQSLMRISYAVYCLKKQHNTTLHHAIKTIVQVIIC